MPLAKRRLPWKSLPYFEADCWPRVFSSKSGWFRMKRENMMKNLWKLGVGRGRACSVWGGSCLGVRCQTDGKMPIGGLNQVSPRHS